MFRLIAHTQLHENYGAHAWNGEGDCPQYWKAKGGHDFVLATLTLQQVLDLGHKGLLNIVNNKKPQFEGKNEYYEEYLIDWTLYGEGELTESESLQMEFDGKITYPPKNIAD